MANSKPTKRETRAQKSRQTILEATMRCLVKYGYSETSTSRVCKEAGLSRGALTHHFTSKTALMVATSDWIMQASIRWLAGRENRPEQTIERHLERLWRQVMNTDAMRALHEILVAIRTDKELADQIHDSLLDWNDTINENALLHLKTTDGDNAKFIRLWTIARIFYRGLLTHDSFVRSEAETAEIVQEFIYLLTPHLQRRSEVRLVSSEG